MASTNLAVTLDHAIAFLTGPLLASYSAATIIKLQALLEANLTAVYAPTWSANQPLRGSARRCLVLAPACPPRPVYAACVAAGIRWSDWIDALGGLEFEFFVDPGCVAIRRAGELTTVYQIRHHNTMPASTAQQFNVNATDGSIISGEDQSFIGDSISGPSFEQPLDSVNFSHMSDKQIWDMFQDASTSVDFFTSSNPNDTIPALPALTLTQPTSGPVSASNDGDVVGPWPLAPAVIPDSTSTAADDLAFPMPDLFPQSVSAAQPGSSSQTAQPYNDEQFLRDIGCDPDAWTNFIDNTNNPGSMASLIPIEGQLPDFGLFNSDFNPWTEPSVENNAPSATPAVNLALATSAPGIVHAQATRLPQPRQPLVAPQFANSGANNVVFQPTASTMGQARYGAPNNANGSFSSFGMGMTGMGGFNTQVMAPSGARFQPSQVPQHRQVPRRAHRARNAQPAQARQFPQFIQGPQQLHPDLYRRILTTNGTPQFIPARPNLQPPFVPAGPVGHFTQIPNTNTIFTPAGRITSTRANPLLNNDAARMKYYRDAKKRALELEEQKMMHQLLAAQLQEVRARDQAREQQLQALGQLLSTVVQPEAQAGAAVPFNGGASNLLPAPQPGSSLSALATSQPGASTSSRVPPPQRVATAFQPASSTANGPQAYQVHRPFDERTFAQGYGMMQPPLFSGAPVQVQQYQQQYNSIPQAYPYFQINDLHQLSNQRSEEYHRGMLQQQQVEQLQRHGSLPQELAYLTNSQHRHRGDGATSSSGSSSKRKRDESGEKGKKHKEAGGDPSPPKRRRENESRGKGKEQEAATVTGNGTSLLKWRHTEYGDQAGEPSNQVGGSSSDTRLAEERQHEPESQIEIREDGPFTYADALKIILRGRYCEWPECDHLIEPRFGAYWEHVSAVHKPKALKGKMHCAVSECGRCVLPENMSPHFDNRIHMNGNWLRCLECGKELGRDELGNPTLHYKRNGMCEEGGKRFAIVERIRPPLRLKAEIPIPLTDGLQDNDGYPFTRGELYIRHIEPLEIDLARQVEYDMDEQDAEWLDAVNQERRKEQLDHITAETFEIIMDRLEKEWFDLTKNLPKSDLAMPSEDSTCAVCDDSEGENSNAIVFCDGCNLAVHQDCYGVPYIPEGQWLCRKCTVSPENPVQCYLCPNEGGAFKQTIHGEWVHLLCAIWVPETRVANDVFMEPITGIEKISKQRWKLRCCICDVREGACIQCAKASCFIAFHATCARQEKLLMPMKTTQGSEPATLQAFCERHLPIEQQNTRAAALEAEAEQDDDNAKLSSKSARAYNKTYKPGPPIVPSIIVNRISQYIHRIKIRKKVEFVQLVCRYWSLKREARRGAPLLKRLHLEPWTAGGGKIQTIEEKRMKLDQLQRLRKDLAYVKTLALLVKWRELRKLKQTEIIHQVLSSALYPHEAALRLALEKIMQQDKQDFFKNPVNKNEVPDYFDIVLNPMCWSMIEDRLDKHEYWDVKSFRDDIDLVINNALLYNLQGTPFWKAALKVRTVSQPLLNDLEKLALPQRSLPHRP
ncbi:hypothetical protein EST38_g11319, partial [Candolleomyces aberdarensis]